MNVCMIKTTYMYLNVKSLQYNTIFVVFVADLKDVEFNSKDYFAVMMIDSTVTGQINKTTIPHNWILRIEFVRILANF